MLVVGVGAGVILCAMMGAANEVMAASLNFMICSVGIVRFLALLC